jgi:hypothetical protein
MVFSDFLVLWLVQVFIFVLGISIGHSILSLRIRQEENRKRELELAMLDKKDELLNKGKKIATDLEEILYQAGVQQQIEEIIRKNKPAKP